MARLRLYAAQPADEAISVCHAGVHGRSADLVALAVAGAAGAVQRHSAHRHRLVRHDPDFQRAVVAFHHHSNRRLSVARHPYITNNALDVR